MKKMDTLLDITNQGHKANAVSLIRVHPCLPQETGSVILVFSKWAFSSLS